MIRREDHGDIRRLVLARAEKRNAIDAGMAQAFIDELRAAEADQGVLAIVLTAEGPVFSAGVDLAERKALADDEAAKARRWALSEAMLLAPGQTGKPVIAAIQANALGAGAALALCCDMAVMAEGAGLAFPETKHGMVPSLMAPVLRPRLSPAVLFRLLATGQSVMGQEALSLGLAAAVAPPSRLLEEAEALARVAATLPVPQMRALKRLCAAPAQDLAESFATARAIVQEIA
ncbi:enoyl-CoA hydratase/isomerase family protein [Acetobacteraceae bacterium H6797]|nr:enoyl-CoA hydratase/isomerase family protein [Acetobacteraceae bacterium H6797]